MKKKYQRVSLDLIQQFINIKHTALIGISQNPKKFGNTIFQELSQKNYHIYPVHPTIDKHQGIDCFREIAQLPGNVESLVICTKPENTLDLVRQAYTSNILHIWLQQGAYHEESIEFALSHKMNIIYGQCILMFLEPVASIHKLHRGLNKFLNIYPKSGKTNDQATSYSKS